MSSIWNSGEIKTADDAHASVEVVDDHLVLRASSGGNLHADIVIGDTHAARNVAHAVIRGCVHLDIARGEG